MQALIAKARVDLDIVPSVAMIVLSEIANFQSVSGLLFSFISTTTIATSAPVLMVIARSSQVHDFKVVRSGTGSKIGSSLYVKPEL